MQKWQDTLFFGFKDKLTQEQKVYLDALQDPDVKLVVVNAKAGTGKTTLAVGAARLSGTELLYVFNPTEEDTLGFTPGEVEDKEKKYLGPLLDALGAIGEKPSSAIHSEAKIGTFAQKEAWVTAHTHVFVRGTNVKKKFVIVDEAQNWTVSDLKKMLTRIHDDCKVVVIGHTGQIDLPDPKLSGFDRLITHFADKKYARHIDLTKNFRGILAQDADEM